MLENNKTYWRGIEELTQTPEFVNNSKKEFSEQSPDSENGGTYRRDFLKLMGFGVAAATLAACETPVRKAIPYLIKPEDVDPTIPNYYASTFIDGGEYCSIIVKTREGRPIKIEGNANSAVNKGGQSARVGASVLSLYDKERYRAPKIAGKNVTWEELDATLSGKLAEVAASGKAVRVVTNTILSPSLNKAVQTFAGKYNAGVVTYDANSASGIIEANAKSFGIAAIPAYDFSKANVIVSFGADFLGTWLSPVEYATQYAAGRKLSKSKKQMSRHYQFETILSTTGSNADFRTAIKPSQAGLIVANLYNLIAAKAGAATLNVGEVKDIKNLQKAADDLFANKGKSLVVSRSNDPNVQLIVNGINNLLGNYGNTLSISNSANYRKGSDASFAKFVEELKGGNVGAVVFLNANPVYNTPYGSELKTLLAKVPVKVSTADRPDETAALCEYIAPDHHYLESWADASPKKGYYSLGQPTISPLFKTRQVIESLLKWSGNATDAYSYIQSLWKEDLFPSSGSASFQAFWDAALHDGVYETKSNAAESASFSYDLSSVVGAISNTYKANAGDIEYVIYEKVSMGTGSQSNNPWLQELPDPVTRACWDNYVAVAPKFAAEKGLEQNDIVKVDFKGGKSIELPVLIQPAQANNTVAIAIGYGREVTGKAGQNVGKNAYPLINVRDNTLQYSGVVTGIAKTGETRTIAQVQTHHTVMGRPIIQEATLADYVKNPGAGRVYPKVATSEGPKDASQISIWNTKGLKTHTYANHFWGMVIDLNSCIGCGACVISCQSENNVPVVGREEVINRREMHWIRIDRYYSSDADPDNDSFGGLAAQEVASENPTVVFQPMMCQHCNNAPCETVCPVLATTHSTEGLNQMTYNRCVGTRYCANNCPYKVRRFNWFKYYENAKFDFNMNDDLGKMVLNPDVTVRARGVMEKCSMCVQRIQAGKLNAKLNSRRPVDGEIVTACAQACPANAIVFGDINDPNSEISKIISDDNRERNYYVLEEINTRPSVSYLTKIRNV